MSALVTPGNLRSALAVTRSLGRRGISVTIADEHPKSLAGSSRYCLASIRVPSPEMDSEAFVHAIRQELERRMYRVVIPTDDVSLWLLAQGRPRFDGLAALPFPGIEAIQIAHDKFALASLAEQNGIPIPKTTVIREPADVSRVVRRVGLPAVVKPRFSKFQRGGQWIKGAGIYYVHTAAELGVACQAIHRTVPFPLVQEYIPGEGRGIFLLTNRGKVHAAFAHRRVREKPPSGGVSVLSESVALEPELLEYSQRLLGALKWHGVAMVEFKRDARDGTAKLLEINGRFWGSLQLAVDAGIDFPYLLYRLAVDSESEPALSYREGVRLRWWLGDLDWLLLRLGEDRKVIARLRAIWEFLSPCGQMTKTEVLRWDDPRPGFEELSQYLGHLSRGLGDWLNGRVRHE